MPPAIASTPTDLHLLGQQVAQHARVPGSVKLADAHPYQDASGAPAYLFSFYVDPARIDQRIALVTSGLSQSLRDALVERGDERYPYLRLLDPPKQT